MNFIAALVSHVNRWLVEEIKQAKYYGIMLNSIPDISQTDQISEIIKYVRIQKGKVEIKEVFLGFFPIKGKKGR